MWDEAVPEMQGGVGVAANLAGDEVILVSLYCTFCGIGTMKVWGTSCNLTLELGRNVWRPPGHSLSRIWYWGVRLRSERWAWRTRFARMSSHLLREVSGSDRMALLSCSYKTMRYLLPREEVTGKRPV